LKLCIATNIFALKRLNEFLDFAVMNSKQINILQDKIQCYVTVMYIFMCLQYICMVLLYKM